MNVDVVTGVILTDHPQAFYYTETGLKEYASYAERKAIAEVMLARIESLYNSNKTKLVTYSTHPTWDINNSRGYTYISGGSVSEIPKPLSEEFKFRIPRNNGYSWALAQEGLSDEIVVSDYDVGIITAYAVAGFTDTVQVPSMEAEVGNLKILGLHEPIANHIQYGKWFVNSGSLCFQAIRQRSGRIYHPPSIPYPLSAINQLSFPGFDAGLVTKVVAEADKGAIDLLTAAAEMPETLRSVINGFKMVAQLVKDAKKREFSLSKAFERRKKILTDRHARDMERLSILQGEARNRAQRRQIEWQTKQKQKTFNRALFETGKEFLDAVASVWLNFRYNIMPNVYLAEDALKLFESWHAKFRTTRGVDLEDLTLSTESWTDLELTAKEICIIKRMLDPKLKNSSLIHANMVTTAWELASRSFVVDWFINIGDILTSIFSPNLALQQGAVYGRKIEFGGSVRNSETNAECRYTCNTFRRRVIEPDLLIGLDLQFDLNVFQQLDALALLWRPIRNSLLSSKR